VDVVAKTLGEMTSDERSDLMDIIAEALEACADDADDAGDSRYVENSMSIAHTIRGMSGDMTMQELASAEQLLVHGVMMVRAFNDRRAFDMRKSLDS
jgi:chemotaxis protein histidine kinase CheA